MNTTFDQVAAYYETCRDYWLRQGDSERVASAKALYWDCVEAWNFDHSWNNAKRDLAEMLGYKEGDPIPAPDAIMNGLC